MYTNDKILSVSRTRLKISLVNRIINEVTDMKRSNEKEETKEDFFNVPNNLCDLHCDLLRKVMRVLLSVRAQEKRRKTAL